MTKTAKFIREKRIERGLSQVYIAKKLNYSSQFIANWERGVSKPPKHVIGDLCKILKVQRKKLVGQILQDVVTEYCKSGEMK